MILYEGCPFGPFLCNFAFLVLKLFSTILGITHFVLKVKEIKENESKHRALKARVKTMSLQRP